MSDAGDAAFAGKDKDAEPGEETDLSMSRVMCGEADGRCLTFKIVRKRVHVL